MIKRINGLLLLLFLVALGAVSCSQQATQEPAQPAAAVSAEPAITTLTPEEKADGWELMFDGKSLDQWRGFRAEEVPPGWTVEDGLLVFKAEDGAEGYGDLTTRKQYASFEMKLDWKISPCGNSGVLFHVTEDSDQEWHSGPEVQIVDATEGCWADYRASDAERAPGSDLKASQFSGADYDLIAPSVNAAKPVGEWNTMRIVVDGAHVEHWLNGQKVVEYELWSPEWKAMVAKSKFAEYPQYGMAKTGYIVLQDHGKTLWFRNLKIKVLG